MIKHLLRILKSCSFSKLSFKIRGAFVRKTRHSFAYPWIYRSYWHYLLHKRQIGQYVSYYSARPNPGAGIGHQIANWIAGYWFAQYFGLKYTHYPFAKHEWEDFLGWGEDEVHINTLKKQGYKIRRLPLFDEFNEKEVALQRAIISSYSTKKVIFLAEQDQFYRDQYGIIEEIRRKFYNAPSRDSQNLLYSNHNLNIAIHVRRGDILEDATNPNLTMRYLANDYYERILSTIIDKYKNVQKKDIHIWFFSQGKEEDYPEFNKFLNLHWCLDMSPQDCFLHMVYADILITSKSSFSYKPALLNKGIKVCPKDFWHGYPSTPDWILVDNSGRII